MITITTEVICSYLKDRFPELSESVRNGHINKTIGKSIGVFLGPETRTSAPLSIGGIDCTVVRQLPINIKIRWSENQVEHDNLSVSIYNKLLLEEDNFMVGDVKIACIEMLDSCPQSLGRDDKNVCESVIRANFYYYV